MTGGTMHVHEQAEAAAQACPQCAIAERITPTLLARPPMVPPLLWWGMLPIRVVVMAVRRARRG